MTGVLLGVDGSPASKRAAEYAARRAHDAGCPLLVAHIIPWSPYSFSSPQENERRTKDKEAALKAAREQVIEPVLALLSGQGLEAESYLRHGDPVDQLIELAERHDLSEIVVGRTGDSRLKRAIFGSIPAHLVQQAPMPVTVVP